MYLAAILQSSAFLELTANAMSVRWMAAIAINAQRATTEKTTESFSNSVEAGSAFPRWLPHKGTQQVYKFIDLRCRHCGV